MIKIIKNMTFISIILAFSLITLSCSKDHKGTKNQKIDQRISIKQIYSKDYPEFYSNRYSYEIKNNCSILNLNKVYNLLLIDKTNLIPTFELNRPNPDFSDNSILNVKEICVGSSVEYLFYKFKEDLSDSLSSILQAEYPLEASGRNKMMLFVLNEDISKIHYISSFIRWTSKQANQYVNIKIKGMEKVPVYMWGINKSTDTVETNLSRKSIQLLFPDFKGKYIFKKYKEIILDYKYSTLDGSFFKHINFIDK